MKKTWIILAVLVIFALVSTVSAYGPMHFTNTGHLIVTYLSKSADWNSEYGIYSPTLLSLGHINDLNKPPGTIFNEPNEYCSPSSNVAVYITVPDTGHGSPTYRSDVVGPEQPTLAYPAGFNHAQITDNHDNSYTVSFEDSWAYSIDHDFNDVVLKVACTQDPMATPEFPSMALPAALIVGLIGAILFIKGTKENE